ncbi:hypothetical protein F2Q70_00020977 [Brassica cretica]|uniref:Uncharacterized protein n=2 Tax=Brassica cretica TaxID=69181 RepID=A0A3N6RH49_BRACR|nr:hypothetical protein F2Q70_00020977 [Brassica cretica]KAF2557847.1 hypothetical protein F2Q68_00014451 [Brassica cretica]KAF3610528.1 hypothetical protein DY000_02046946 [Brassica cretica]
MASSSRDSPVLQIHLQPVQLLLRRGQSYHQMPPFKIQNHEHIIGKIMSDLEESDDSGAFWRYLEKASELTIEHDHRCMPISTRSNKEIQLLFSSDSAILERSIHKGRRSPSIDNNTSSLLDSRQPLSTQTPVSSTEGTLPSTDILHPTSIDTSVQTSIDTEPRDMVATLILVRDEKGDLHDHEGHLRNAPGQRIYA